MARFRKKPVVIEAEQFLGQPITGVQFDDEGKAFVETMHAGQICFLEVGDFVVPEPDGVHFYPIKEVVFWNTYDPVE